MRRHAILLTLLATDLGVSALALVVHLKLRPPILRAFAEFNTEMPRTAAIALSSWFLPAALAISALLGALGGLAPLRRSTRAQLAGTGVVIISLAVIFAAWAALLPIFQPG